MNLCVKREYDQSFVEGTWNLSTAMLSAKSTHFVIASNLWDNVYIELEDSIPEGYLSYLSSLSKDIKVNLPDNITPKTVHLLTELYPDKAGKIRRSYMTNADMSEVLQECLVS